MSYVESYGSLEYYEKRVKKMQLVNEAVHKHVATVITDKDFDPTTENIALLAEICGDTDRDYKEAVDRLFEKKKELGIVVSDDEDGDE